MVEGPGTLQITKLRSPGWTGTLQAQSLAAVDGPDYSYEAKFEVQQDGGSVSYWFQIMHFGHGYPIRISSADRSRHWKLVKCSQPVEEEPPTELEVLADQEPEDFLLKVLGGIWSDSNYQGSSDPGMFGLSCSDSRLVTKEEAAIIPGDWVEKEDEEYFARGSMALFRDSEGALKIMIQHPSKVNEFMVPLGVVSDILIEGSIFDARVFTVRIPALPLSRYNVAFEKKAGKVNYDFVTFTASGYRSSSEKEFFWFRRCGQE
jgi:hypothetical protein